MQSGTFPFLLPLAALLAVAVVMIGLGTLFSAVGENGTVGIGLGITIGTGTIGFLLARRYKDPS